MGCRSRRSPGSGPFLLTCSEDKTRDWLHGLKQILIQDIEQHSSQDMFKTIYFCYGLGLKTIHRSKTVGTGIILRFKLTKCPISSEMVAFTTQSLTRSVQNLVACLLGDSFILLSILLSL